MALITAEFFNFVVADELDWQEHALCAQTDPELFFPEKGGSTRDAKRVCAGCEVRAECLEHALRTGERFGIWGGLSERERARLRRSESDTTTGDLADDDGDGDGEETETDEAA